MICRRSIAYNATLLFVLFIGALMVESRSSKSWLSSLSSIVGFNRRLVSVDQYAKEMATSGMIVYEPKPFGSSKCDNPYVTVQSMLLQDSPHLMRPHYHVMLTTSSKEGQPCPFSELQVRLLDKSAAVFAASNAKVERLKFKQLYETMATNALGRVSLYLPVSLSKLRLESLSSPALLVRTPSMKVDEELLIFPDKPVLHFLMNVDAETLRSFSSNNVANSELQKAADALQLIASHQLSAVPIAPNGSHQIFVEHEHSLFTPELPYRSRAEHKAFVKRSQLRGLRDRTIGRKDRTLLRCSRSSLKNKLLQQIGERHYDDEKQLVSAYLVQSPKGKLFDSYESSQNFVSPEFSFDFGNEVRDHASRLERRSTATFSSDGNVKVELAEKDNKIVASISESGRLRRFIVNSVRSALGLVGRILRSVGVSLGRMLKSVVNRLNLDGVMRVQKFLKHYTLVRRTHIRDSLNVISGDLAERWFSNSSAKLDALRNVSVRLGDNSIADMLNGKDGVLFGSTLVKQNAKHMLSGRTKKSESQPTSPGDQLVDVRAAHIENELVDKLGESASQLDESLTSSAAQAELVDEANAVVSEILEHLSLNSNEHDKRRLSARNLIFKAKEELIGKPFKFFLHTIARLFSGFRPLLQHAGATLFASLAKMNDLYFRAIQTTFLRPIFMFTKKFKQVDFLDMATMFGAPVTYYQYKAIRRREPFSASDIDVLLSVSDPMLFKHAWNQDNPSAEVSRMRDGILDWIPRAFMASMTWTSVVWAHTTAVLARRLPTLKAYKDETGNAFRYNLYRTMFEVSKWSRQVTGWKIGFLLGALSYPVSQAKSNSPKDISSAIGTISYSSWGMWAWWMFPVVWKTALPLTQLLKERQIKNSPQDVFEINAFYAHAESVITGVPMVVAFSTVLYDVWSSTDLRNLKQLYTSATSTLAWMLDGLSNFLSEPIFSGHVWQVLYGMCGWYQARVTGMMVFDIVGFGDTVKGRAAAPNTDESVEETNEQRNFKEVDKDIEAARADTEFEEEMEELEELEEEAMESAKNLDAQ